MENDSTFDGRIPARVALALLESLRAVDMPTDPDDLGESDLPLNLHRRLGISSVIIDQIRRYERQRASEIPAREVASLFELIGRRSDASRIFVEAGQRIARADLAGRRGPARLGTRILPQRLRERRALNRARRIAQRMRPGAEIRVRHRPHALIMKRGLPASAAADGTGCAVLAGAIQYVFSEFRAGDFNVVHDHCEAHDGDRCEWSLDAFETGSLTAARESPDSTNNSANGVDGPEGHVEEKAPAAHPEPVPGG